MKQRKMITWLLVLTMALSLFSAAAFADEPEEGDSPAAEEAAGETLEAEEAEEAEAEEEEAEEPAEPAESEEPTVTEEEAISEEPALLLGSAANEGILLASDNGTSNVAYIGDQGYEDLADAVADANAATEAVTIKLNDDVSITSSLTISNTSAAITLDLNGHSITCSDSSSNVLKVSSGATLTVTDGGSGEGVISGTKGIESDGTLYFTGGTISATSTGIYNVSGTLNVSGGTVSVTGGTTGEVYAVRSSGGTVSVSDGTISATGGATSYGIYLSGTTEVTVSGGTISGETCGIFGMRNESVHTLTISGGTITGVNDDAVYLHRGNFTMTGGTITAGPGTGAYGVYVVKGSITITGGEITSTASIGVSLTGGSFSMSGGS
ncbi:MAG: carbohydrate-binding domain-containing protein, partial [Oscillospiraceae bacterium]|nr:carbohydrate-binding domain-containing protein [Oscillospiraceae bacterium]